MRGHAKGPFNSLGVNTPNPVLRVQQQIHLTPGSKTSVQIEASLTQPTLLKMVVNVVDDFATGANSLVVGNSSVANAYFATGDTTLSSLGFNTEKKFLLTAPITLIALLTSAAVAASLALTLSAITGANTQTVSVGGVTYNFNTALTNTANNVLIGADTTAMAANLAAAINAGAGSGTTYGAGTVANPLVTAVAALGVVTVTSIVPGTGGNSIVTGETLTNGAWAGGATTLAGGAAVDPTGSAWLLIDA